MKEEKYITTFHRATRKKHKRIPQIGICQKIGKPKINGQISRNI